MKRTNPKPLNIVNSYSENMINIKKIEEKENPILKRKDLLLMLDHKGEATPSANETTDMIAKKFKGDAKKTEIVYMFSEKGKAKTKVKAFIWEDKIVEKSEEKKPEKKERPEEKPEEKKEAGEKKEEKKPEEKPKEEPDQKKEEKSKEKSENKESKKEENTNKSKDQKDKSD